MRCDVHTRIKLDGRDLVMGLGLAAFILILFPAPVSGTMLVLLASPGPVVLLGRVGLLVAAPFVALGGAAGCSMIVAADGRRNIPRPISQSKYRSPLTLPSFFPSYPSSSTPIHSPAANSVCPT